MNESLDAVFSALAAPPRRAPLARLAEGEAPATSLAAPFAISQPAVSRHLKVLEGAGLIERRAEGARRICRLSPEALSGPQDWLGGLREVLEARYARLDAMLEDDP